MAALSLTWSDLLLNVLKRINVLQPGEPFDPNDQADAFTQLQLWVDSLALDGLIIPYVLRTTWAITSTKGTLANPYLIGAGQDLNISKPAAGEIKFIRFQDTTVTPTLEYPLTLLTDDAWALVPQKNLTSPLPTSAYYNPTFQDGVSNYGSLYLWPVPTRSNLQGVLYAKPPVPTPINLTDTIVLPQGYQFFIQENMAVELASTFRDNMPADPLLVRSAADAKMKVKRSNVHLLDLSVDPAVQPRRPGRYNINSDTFN